MNRHFKTIYLNVLHIGCKISFKDGYIMLKYKYPGSNNKWKATIKDGKYLYGDIGKSTRELPIK